MSDHYKRQDEAAESVKTLLALPIPENADMMGCDGYFDPWEIFPAIYGTYSADFDKCALDVLCDLRDGTCKRMDLPAFMLKEMLCVSNLCDYGTSPRVCFPTQTFKALLPGLVEKWREWALLAWGDSWDQE